MRVGKDATYTSEQAVQEFVHTLTDRVKNGQLEAIRDIDIFSIMTDETTDI